MESTNDDDNQSLFLSEFKELRKEFSAVKKRMVEIEKSHEKQQERIDILERENHALKTQLNINGNTTVGSTLKRKRTDQDPKEEIEESKSTSASIDKKTKTNNNDDEAGVISRYDNGDSFDSLSDDLLHKIVEFDGNCYGKFGSINKRCRNLYDVKEYKLNKVTCVYGYGTVDMMLQHYLQKRKEETLTYRVRNYIAAAVIWYNRVDVIEWIVQLGDNHLLGRVCCEAAEYGRINILSIVFCKCDLETLDPLLDGGYYDLCRFAVHKGKLETLKWLRKYGAVWDSGTFDAARFGEYDEIIQYLRAEGCPETLEDTDESPVGSDDEDGDY